MSGQQGELLCNLDAVNFSITLWVMLSKPEPVKRQVVSRIVLKRDQRIKLLEELRKMGIHHESLFPGLEGFARSLGANLEISIAEQIEAEIRKAAVQNEIVEKYRAEIRAEQDKGRKVKKRG